MEKIKIQKGSHIIKNPQNLHFLFYLHIIYLVKQLKFFISYLIIILISSTINIKIPKNNIIGGEIVIIIMHTIGLRIVGK
jgi:hypothetical protein